MTALFAAQKIEGGTVHVVQAGRGRVGLGVSTFCTGRSMSWMVSTDGPVTCKACIRKADSLGMDLKELGR